MRTPRSLLATSVMFAALGCIRGGALNPPPGGPAPDAGASDVPAVDAGPPRTIAEVPIAETLHVRGLDGPVDVVIDRYGWPHITATSLRDAGYAQGLITARDRMPQMELLRRVASGTLAEIFGSLDASVIERDIAIRVIGLRRTAEAIWAATQPGRGRAILEGYAAGVNAYLADVRAGARRTPNGTELVVFDATPDWTPVDSLAVGRLEALSQSYAADDEVSVSQYRERAHQVFDLAQPGSAEAARAGFFWDFANFRAASDTQVVPGFYGAGSGSPITYRPDVAAPQIGRGTYDRLMPFFRALRDAGWMFGGHYGGSNNYVVRAANSATGHALLESDPHMDLPAPPIWYGVHLRVTQGADAAEVTGVSLPGAPGVVIGYTPRVAWGITNAFFDTVDEYAETVTPGQNGSADTVLFRGAQVPIQTIVEHIPNGQGGVVDVPIEVVPHHGPLAVEIRGGRIVPRTGTRAISVRWVGHAPTRELDALVGLMYSRNVAEARAALGDWGTPPMNFVFADVDGQIGFSARSIVPIRQAGARTWAPDSAQGLQGTMPCGVLPGTGEAEWDGNLDAALIPWGEGSDAHPFFVTANNDQAGNAQDNNPLNDRAYLACKWAWGWRAERITERLRALGNHVTVQDMVSINADQHVLAGGRFRPFIDAAIGRLEQEWTTPGTHADLAAVARDTMPRAAQLRDARARLMAWTLDGADGTNADATPEQRADSAATLVFHAFLVRFLDNTFGDEVAAMGVPLEGYATDQFRVGAALFLMEHPRDARTYDAARAQSSVWDDLRTRDVRETLDALIVRSLDEALAEVARRTMSADLATWRWGALHTLRFDSMVPGPGSVLSVPRANDPMFPNGFPRGGGLDVVNASEPGTSDFNFSYSSGPTQRFVVDMDPAGPHALNALPGGESADPQSRHHRDEAELWRTHAPHPIPRSEAEVAGNAEARIRLEPAP